MKSIFRSQARCLLASRSKPTQQTAQSFNFSDVQPFKDHHWFASPFAPHNLPKTSPVAKRHVSLGCVSHFVEGQGWWHVIDMAERYIHPTAREIARLLVGKHRVDYQPHKVCGDAVIVVNAIRGKLLGNSWDTRVYKIQRGRGSDPRGAKVVTAKTMFYRNPAMPLYFAIRGILPRNLLRNNLMRRVAIYPGAIHPHERIPQAVVPYENVEAGCDTRGSQSGARGSQSDDSTSAIHKRVFSVYSPISKG